MTGLAPWDLSQDEAGRDHLHRFDCRDGLCGDIAHRYIADIWLGQVFVDGVPFLAWRPPNGRRSR